MQWQALLMRSFLLMYTYPDALPGQKQLSMVVAKAWEKLERKLEKGSMIMSPEEISQILLKENFNENVHNSRIVKKEDGFKKPQTQNIIWVTLEQKVHFTGQ
jgi:hypothetical protein